MINWYERCIWINLGETENVLCGSNGLITRVIKWAKLERNGFGVKLFLVLQQPGLVGIAADSSRLEMGLEQGKLYHPLTWAPILLSGF